MIQIDKLGEINRLSQEKDSDISITVRKLAIVSQLEVFKDIIPGYKSRPIEIYFFKYWKKKRSNVTDFLKFFKLCCIMNYIEGYIYMYI